MKKFTTTFFLLMAMLLIPSIVRAVDYHLVGSFANANWDTSKNKMTQVGTSDFYQLKIKGSEFSAEELKVYCSDGTYYGKTNNTINTGSHIYGLDGGNNITCGTVEASKDYIFTFDASNKNLYLEEVKEESYYLVSEDLTSWGTNKNNGKFTYKGDNVYTFETTGDKISKSGDNGGFKIMYGDIWMGWNQTDNFNTQKTELILKAYTKNIYFTSADNASTYVVIVTKVGTASNSALLSIEKKASTIKTEAKLKYGTTEIISESIEANGVYTFANIPYTAFSGTSVSFQLKTVTDGVTTYYNMPNGTTSINAGQGYTTETSATGSDWTYTKTTAPNKGTFTVTLNTADNTVTLTDNTSYTEAPTPVTGQNLYLVGNFFDNETLINYDRRYFKLTDNGDNTYSIDIPATLSINAQLLHVDGENETVYGPNSDGYGISNTWPSGNNGSVENQPLVEGSKTPTKYWTFADRGLDSDGMYTLTVKLNDEGVPNTWSITHDLLNRVAYFIAATDGAVAHPAYSKRNDASSSGSNKYFGSVYLPANVGCYVISNITKNADTNKHSLLKTTTKFYLQGNTTGNSPALGSNENTKVFPVIYNGTTTAYNPFVFSKEEGLQYLLEYNPSQGEDETAKNYSYIGGEVQRREAGTLGSLTISSMKIVGPAINGNGWDLTENALDMHYNVSENCWEVTFDTTAPAGNVFRFVANDKWENSWQENSTEQTEIAKIPYDGNGEGQPATVAVPNDVSYISSITSAETRNPDYDIIFNRDGGRWTVKFYIDTESSQGGNWFDYKFNYTINGTPTVNVPVDLTYRVNKFIRSFSYGDNLDLPTDGSVKAYEAYRFEQGDKATKKHGTVYLRRIEYIPANMGVILVGEVPEGSGTFEDGNVKAFNLTKRTAGLVDKNEDLWTLKDSYKNDENWNEWNNYLVGTVTAVNDLGNAEVVDGKVTKRYFGLGHYYATNEYKKTGVGDDYIGFFRYTANAISGANKAYLSIPTATGSKFGYIDFNGQWLDDNYDSPNDEISTLSKAGIIFDDIDFDETTAISNVNANEKNVNDGAYYTLQGIKVAKPTQGLYIHNGKKVIIK